MFLRGLRRSISKFLVLLTLTAALAPSRGIAQTSVDLELALAVDVSFSMDAEEQRLQREGYIQAFRSKEILNAIKSGQHGRIAVSYIEWAGLGTQAVLLPWTLIDGEASASAFADALASKPLRHDRRTSISAALEFTREYFRQSAFKGTRRVIDVSGDGPNNAGRAVDEVRNELLAQGFIINGLPIIIRPSSFGSRFDIPDLDIYYAKCVIGGPGAFMIPIKTRPEFLTATRQKLLLEIAAAPSAPLPVIKAQFRLEDPTGADCLVGEKRRRSMEYWDGPP